MVGIGPISFGLVYLGVAKWVTLLSVSIYLQLQNRKGCKADPPPTEVTGDGKFYFSKIVVVSLYVDEQPYHIGLLIWLQ